MWSKCFYYTLAIIQDMLELWEKFDVLELNRLANF